MTAEVRSPVLKSDRQHLILTTIGKKGSVSVDEIANMLDVSAVTVRRDLDFLGEEGLVKRTRGGAQSNSVSIDMPLQWKRSRNYEEKRALARHCAESIPSGAAIGMSGGTTMACIAQEIFLRDSKRRSAEERASHFYITVVTNAIDIALLLSKSPSVKVIVIGGVLNNNSLEISGPLASDLLDKISLDMSFVGINGFDNCGPGTADENEGHSNKRMLSRSLKKMIVADSSKFGRHSFFQLNMSPSEVTLITDDSISQTWSARAKELGYTLKTVPVDSSGT